MDDDLRFQLSGNAAENYERYSSVMLDPFIDEMLARTAPGAGTAFLDVACGTGRVGRAACSMIGAGGDVHGLDINPGMLSTAAELAADEGRTITWHEASAESMPLPDDHFDVVVCSMGVMFFADLAAGLGEMVRVTKPGGTVLVVVFGPVDRNPYMAAQAGHLDAFIDAGAAKLLDHACRLGVEDLSAAFGALAVSDVEGDTVEREISIPRLDDYLAVHIGGLPYAATFHELPEDAKQDYRARVRRDLAAYEATDGELNVPFVLHFVSATVEADRNG